MPDEMEYDEARRRLLVGKGFVENVPPEVWNYEVAGKRVLTQWFGYRKKNRERPIIGDRRPPSKLGDIQPNHWLAEYTTELLNVLHVLALLVEMEPAQAQNLEAICAGPTLDFQLPTMSPSRRGRRPSRTILFGFRRIRLGTPLLLYRPFTTKSTFAWSGKKSAGSGKKPSV